MVIVRFLSNYGAFQAGEVGGVGADVAKKLLAGGHAELHEDGSPREVTEEERDRDEEMVVVRFIKAYGRFQPGEIAAVYESSTELLFKPDPVEGRPTAELYGSGRIDEKSDPGESTETDADESGDAGGTFDADDKAAMQEVDGRLEEKVFDALGDAGITSAPAVLNAGMAGLQVDVKGVGKKTSEKLISAATTVLRDRGVSI